MPSLLEYAALSAIIYNNERGQRTESINTLPLPGGWEPLSAANGFVQQEAYDENVFSFTAGAYVNRATGEIVIAYKGTDFLLEWQGRAWNTVGDLLTDVAAGLGNQLAAPQFVQAAMYYRDVADWAAANGFQSSSISFTGHSLGGGLASTMSAWFSRPASTFAQAPFEESARSVPLLTATLALLSATGSVPSEFQEIVASLGAAIGSREALVQNHYISGEFLQYLRTDASSFGSDVIAINVGEQPLSSALSLHSMNLHAAMLFSEELAVLCRGIPELVPTLLDLRAHSHDPNGTVPDLVTSLVRDHIAAGFTGGSALVRFTEEISALMDVQGTASNAGMRSALIAAVMDHFYYGGSQASDPALSASNDVVHLDLSLTEGGRTVAPGMLANALWSLEGADADTLELLAREAQMWHVQAGDESMAWSGEDSRDDIAIGGDQADSIDGGDGSDVLVGLAGADVLNGSAGADYLYGGTGDDTLNGGTSGDYLYGGEGDDTYQFDGAHGGDWIVDSDGHGSITVNGVAVTGAGSRRIAENVYAGGEWVYSVVRRSDDEADLVIRRDSSLNSITIRGWTNGGLGISLSEETPDDTTEAIVYGDFIKRVENGNYVLSSGPEDPIGYANAGVAVGAEDVLFAVNSQDTTLYGLDGNDMLAGGDGDDRLIGGQGTDVLFGDAGRDEISGGDGNDFIFGSGALFWAYDFFPQTPEDGQFPPALGTELARGFGWVMYAQPLEDNPEDAADQWSQLGYNFDALGAVSEDWYDDGNVIDAGAGDDWVAAGNDEDVVHGGDGKDVLFGMDLSDVVYGDDGDDYVAGDGGDSEGLRWTPAELHGNDVLYGGAGEDVVIGQGGDDRLFGGDDDDNLFGDSDRITGVAFATWAVHGQDFLDGGAGNDFLIGHGLADTLLGGQGRDTLWGDDSGEDYPLYMWGADYLDGGDGDDVILGQGGEDTIFGGEGHDSIHGDAHQEDVAVEAHGDDYIDAEGGNDVVAGDGGSDTIYGGSGNDSLYGDGGSDAVAAVAHGDDYIDGEDGDDTISGDGGRDTLYGGSGNDTINGDAPDLGGAEHADDYIDGEDGNDVLFGEGGDDVVIGGEGDDRIGGDNVANVLASSHHGQDSLDGGAGNDVIFGHGGNDSLIGGDGNDTLSGDDQEAIAVEGDLVGDDYLDGGNGDDLLFGGLGNDRLAGGSGNDLLVGGSGNDVLIGGSGVDVALGGDGDDILVTSDGGYLDGGSGNDQYRVAISPSISNSEPSFTTIINDRSGVNTIHVSGTSVAAQDMRVFVQDGGTFLAIGQDGIIQLGDDVSLMNTSVQSGTGEAVSLESLVSSNGRQGAARSGYWTPEDGLIWSFDTIIAQTLRAGGRAGSLEGGSGDDVLQGGAGADKLFGNDGADEIYGASGGDWIEGGSGDDLLVGGSGLQADAESDVFMFNRGDGRDTLRSIAPPGGQLDTIRFGEGISRQDLTVAYEGSASDGSGVVSITYGDGDVITLEGGSFAAIDQVEFADGTSWSLSAIVSAPAGNGSPSADGVIRGDVGNDTLVGSSWSDRIEGGVGDDDLTGGVGNDLLVGGPGTNTYRFMIGDGHDIIQPVAGEVGVLVFEQGVDLHVDGADLLIAHGTDMVRLSGYASDPSIAQSWQIQAGGAAVRSLGQAVTEQDDVEPATDLTDRRQEFLRSQLWDLRVSPDIYDHYEFGSVKLRDVVHGTVQMTEGNALRTGLFVDWEYESTTAYVTSLQPVYAAVQQGLSATVGSYRYVGVSDMPTGPLPAGAVPSFNEAGELHGYIVPPSATAGSVIPTTRIAGYQLQTQLVTTTSAVAHGIQQSVVGTAGQDTVTLNWGQVGHPVWEVNSLSGSFRGSIETGAGADIVTSEGLGSFGVGADWGVIRGVEGIREYDGLAYLSIVHADRGLGAWIDGGAGDDLLHGTEANDVIIGGEGSDILDGKQGSDTYLVRASLADIDRIDDLASFDWMTDLDGGLRDIYAQHADLRYANRDRVEFDAGISIDQLSFQWGEPYASDPYVEEAVLDRRDLSLFLNGRRFLDIAYATDALASVDHAVSRIGIEEFAFAGGQVLSLAGLLDQLSGSGPTGEHKVGTSGADELIGGAGNDVLEGGEGDDILDGGAGNDVLTGGSGNDTYRFGMGSGHDVIEAASDANYVRSATLAFGAGVAASDLRLRRDGAHLVISIAGASDRVTINGFFAQNSSYNVTNPVQRFTFSDATVWGLSEINANAFVGGDASEVMAGTNQDDAMSGGAGDDQLSGDFGNDELAGGAGNDVLDGGWGDDVLVGGAGDDVLDGGEGNDSLDGGTGNDRLIGTGGNNLYRFGRGDGHDSIEDGRWNMGDRVSVLEFKDDVAVSDIRMRRMGDALEVSIVGTQDRVTLTTFFLGGRATNGFNPVYQFRWSDGTQWSLAEITQRVMDGTDGDDVVQGTLDGDVMSGGLGNDILDGDLGNDTVDGGAGDDVVAGGYGNDTLLGSEGDDQLDGGDGDDVLDGGAGNDTLRGTGGANTYRFGRGYGQDFVDESRYNNGTVVNTLEFLAGVAPSDLRFSRVDAGTDLRVAIDGTADAITVNNFFLYGTTRSGFNPVQQFRFADGTTWDLEDIRQAAFHGTSGDDVIQGSNENDVLEGGAGADLLAGGQGSDTYRFSRGDGADVVVDDPGYEAGATDVLSFGADIAASQIWLRQVGGDLEVSLIGTGDRVTVQDWYDSPAFRLEELRLADGRALLQSQVASLVDAMAQFSPPVAGQTTLPQAYQDQLGNLIATSWQGS